jgi:hypothetical protein
LRRNTRQASLEGDRTSIAGVAVAERVVGVADMV